MKWYSKIWGKLVLEVIVAGLLWVIFTFVKTLLPKKWRIDDQRLKKALKDLSIIFDNIARPTDTLPQTLIKSKNIFNHFYQQGLERGVLVEDFKKYIETIENSEYHLVQDYNFIETIYPQLESYAFEIDYVNDIGEGKQIIRASFNILEEEHYIYLVKNSALAMPGRAEYQHFFAVKKGFDYFKLIGVFFAINGNEIELSFAQKLSVKRLEVNEDEYIPDVNLISKLENEIKRFKVKDRQRSILFEGPPGTGKSTCAIYLARKLKGKIVKLNSSVFVHANDNVIKSLLTNLNADFLILDDIDHIAIRDMSQFLFTLENVKKFKNSPTLVATCNNIFKLDKACIRPGRFDRIIPFHAPKLQKRVEFLENLFRIYDLHFEKKDIYDLAKATDGMSEAYLKEYALLVSIGDTVPEIIQEIKNRRKYLGKTSLEDLEEDSDTKQRIEFLTNNTAADQLDD